MQAPDRGDATRPEPGTAIAAALERALQPKLAGPLRRPFVLGLCGAQGSGKSTAAALLARRLTAAGRRAVTLSLDDLYLPVDDRIALTAMHPLLRTRGVPGTHDVALGLSVIAALGRDEAVAIPRFDKVRDTRHPRAGWETVIGPVEVIIFEGWCVGARPQPGSALAAPINLLERDEDADATWRTFVNEALGGPYRALFDRVDFLALLAAPGFEVVARWRGEQERAVHAAAASDAGMDEAAIARFVAHYQRLTEHILAEMPARANLVLRLNEQRRIVGKSIKAD